MESARNHNPLCGSAYIIPPHPDLGCVVTMYSKTGLQQRPLWKHATGFCCGGPRFTAARNERSAMRTKAILFALVLCLSAPLYAQEFPADTRPFVNLAYKFKGSDEYAPVGSGTIINASGLIVTNEHVFNLSSAAEEDRQQLDLTVAYVLYDHDSNRHTPPVLTYVAEKLAYWFSGFPGEPDYDVALMRITRDLGTGSTVTNPNFPFIPLGNPFDLPDNAAITILGFPSVGGRNLSISSGPWISYQEGNPLGIPDGAILTTAAIWPGNSGGAALYNGRLIGLPTSQASAEVDAGYIHPITWASPLLGYVEYKLGVATPNINKDWVETDRNRDLWTRTRSTFMARITSEASGQPIAGATVFVYPADKSFDEVKRLHTLSLQASPHVSEQNGRIDYGVATSKNDGFFETWVEKGRSFRVSIEAPGYAPYHSNDITAGGHVVQWMTSPFVLSPGATGSGFSAASATVKQSITLAVSYPTDFRKTYWDQDRYITGLSYTNGLWAMTLSDAASYTSQHNAVRATYDEIRAVILEKWGEGYYITDLARGNGEWAVSMTKGTVYTDQAFWYATTFPKDWVQARWDEGYDITDVTFGDGSWVIVMSKGTGWSAQSWTSRDAYEDIRTYIQGKWDEGYAITNLAYGNGLWLVVVNKGTGLYEQTFARRSSSSTLHALIEEQWQAGKPIRDLTFDQDHWWILFSKGTEW